MSKFRVELDIAFETEKEAKALLNLVEEFKAQGYKDTGVLRPLMIVNTCRYHECFHDEVPAQQCGGYVSVDFDGAKVEHTYKDNGVDVVAVEDDLIKKP